MTRQQISDRLDWLDNYEHCFEYQPWIALERAKLRIYVERIKGIGNAVVPQVAQWIGERILEASK